MVTKSYSPQSTGYVPKGHETRDVRVGSILGCILFLGIAGLAIHFVLAGMLSALSRRAQPTDLWRPVQPATPKASGQRPFPLLQVSPPADLEAFRAREQAELETYGWVNRTSGLVRIPIEEAMRLLAQKGLPVRSNSTQAHLGPSAYELLQKRLRETSVPTNFK